MSANNTAITENQWFINLQFTCPAYWEASGWLNGIPLIIA